MTLELTTEDMQACIAVGALSVIAGKLEGLVIDSRLTTEGLGSDVMLVKIHELNALVTFAANCRDRFIRPEIGSRRRFGQVSEALASELVPEEVGRSLTWLGKLGNTLLQNDSPEDVTTSSLLWFACELSRLASLTDDEHHGAV